MMRLVMVLFVCTLSACVGPTSDSDADSNVCVREAKWDPDCIPDFAYECTEDEPPASDCYRIGVGDAYNVAWCCPSSDH